MRFQFAGDTYSLEFSRQHRTVSVTRNGKVERVRSKYPFTTASLESVGKLGTKSVVIASHTVGCAPTDKYSNAEGRLAALRGLTDKIDSKGLRTAMWQAYVNRGK